MKTPKLAIAMGHIDDDLVSGAVVYQPIPYKKTTHIGKHISAVAASVVLILGIGFLIFNNSTSQLDDTPPASDAPAHFYYGGNLYLYSGQVVYSLPDDFEFAGEVKNVGDSFTGVDFEGNVDGYVFISETDQAIIYFQWKEWDESVDGEEPYLALILNE